MNTTSFTNTHLLFINIFINISIFYLRTKLFLADDADDEGEVDS